MFVIYNLRKSLQQIIAARLLKLIVLYIHIDESVWPPNTELKFFRTRFVKRRTSWKVHFPDNVTLNSWTFLEQAPTMVEGLKFHSSQQYIYVPLFPKILWVQNSLKFISGNYNVCETRSSFIKKLRHD